MCNLLSHTEEQQTPFFIIDLPGHHDYPPPLCLPVLWVQV